MPTAPKGDVVEIGSLYGKSSYVLNVVAAYCGVGATLCIDPWALDTSVQHDARSTSRKHPADGIGTSSIPASRRHARLRCSAVQLSESYVGARKAEYQSATSVTSREFGPTDVAGSIAVLHLDGTTMNRCCGGFRVMGPLRAALGWIIFDDYNWPHGDGPRKVADRVIAEYGPRIERSFIAGGAMFINLTA